MPSTPRVHARHLPRPGPRQLAERGFQIWATSARRLGPLFLREANHLRHGVLDTAAIATPLRRIFEHLGGTFIKFGQVIASSPGLFGEDLSQGFRSTLDCGPAVPFEEIAWHIEDELGMTLEEAFAEFEPEPIGRASIAVVHKARLHDGREVAVKVLRPGIESLVAADLALMEPLMAIVARETGDQTAGSMLQALDALHKQLGEELDLRNEARAMQHFRELTDEIELPMIVVPEPYPELSGTNVLTMEYLDGVAVDDLAKVAELGYDPAPVVEQVVKAFFITTVRWGAFHGDLHAGNMLLLRDGRIGIIDWGIVGRLDPETHRFFVRLLEGVLGDESAWADITKYLTKVYGPAIQTGLGLDDDQLAAFLRSLIEPTLTRPFGEVSLATLFEAPQIQAAKAEGVVAHHRSLRAQIARMRAGRKMRRIAEGSGGLMSDFDRSMFLLGKALVYFERYGKLFLSDRPIMADREFIASLVAGAER